MLPVTLVALLACSSGPASIVSKKGAPFDLKGVSTALFAFEDSSDARYGNGVLLLSSDDVACNQVLDIRYSSELYELVDDSSGVIMMFDYSNYDADRGGGMPSWEGLWMGGYAVAYEAEQYRSMGMVVFDQGFLYASGYYGGGGGWAEITDDAGGTVSGSFDHTYWKGKFNAENCGGYGKSGGNGRDTGWHY